MQRKLSQSVREFLEGEIAHLRYLSKNIYYEQPGFIDHLKYNLGLGGLTPRKKQKKYSERISREDNEKILALIKHLEKVKDETIDCTDQELIDSYGDGYTLETGMPVWAKSTPLYQFVLKNEKKYASLGEHPNSLPENLIIAGDIIKRTTDLAEDVTSTLRSANLLASLSKDSMRGTIGGLNLINLIYEFLKGAYDFITAYKGDDKHKPELLTESGMRTTWSLTGIVTFILYMAKVIFLPIALLGISIVMLPIFMAILAKDIYLYFEANGKEEESSSPEFKSTHKRLEENIKELKPNELKPDKLSQQLYQLASMEHRQDTDTKILAEAKREVRYTAIDLLAYLFIAAASCSAIIAYYFSAPVQIIVGKLALTATIIGVTTATVAKIVKSRHAIAQAAENIYKHCKEKLTNLFAKNKPGQTETNTPKPGDHSDYQSENTSSDHSLEGIESEPPTQPEIRQSTPPIDIPAKKPKCRVIFTPENSFSILPSVAKSTSTIFSQSPNKKMSPSSMDEANFPIVTPY